MVDLGRPVSRITMPMRKNRIDAGSTSGSSVRGGFRSVLGFVGGAQPEIYAALS